MAFNNYTKSGNSIMNSIIVPHLQSTERSLRRMDTVIWVN